MNEIKAAWDMAKMNDVACITFDAGDNTITSDWEQWILLSSDWHWDNAHCDLPLLKRDMQEAKNRQAAIFAFGDLFCLMQGRYDPRRSRSGMRRDLDQDNYLDCVVNKAADWFAPYAENVAFASRGNHEISNMRNNDTDVLERWCERMRLQGSGVITGGIGGWVFIRVLRNGRSHTLKLNFHHGAGGGGPVTKGVIKTNRRAVYLPQADLCVSGHIHERWVVSSTQEMVTDRGRRFLKEQTHICLPTYKQEYHPDGYDFHNLNERPPKPTGGCFLRLYFESDLAHGGAVLKYQPIFT